MIATSTGFNEDSMTIDQYAGYAASTLARSLEKTSGKYINTSLYLSGVTASKVVADEFCIGVLCVNSGSIVTKSIIDEVSTHMNASFTSIRDVLDTLSTRLDTEIATRRTVTDRLDDQIKTSESKLLDMIQTLS